MSENKSGQRLGQAFWIGFWVLLLLLLTVLFNQWQEGRRYPNQDPVTLREANSRTLELQRNQQGHYIAHGSINRVAATFLVDTGATDIVIPAKQALRMGLTMNQPGRARTANGVITVYRTRIDELRLGPLVLRDLNASINQHMDGDILLGMSALQRLELRQHQGVLSLTQRIP